jgi:DeoR family transcriptional regulator, aga operon transcriptional repressor
VLDRPANRAECVSYLARMRQADRLATVLDELSANGSVSVAELSARFGVSVATVRRDLQLLEKQRLVSRVHGGAVARGILYELPLRYKVARHQEEKRRIALAAADRAEEGSTVGLTGGTTSTEVGRALSEVAGLTVVTNALNLASELAVRSNLKLVVPGGVARASSYELVGPIADTALAGLNLDLVFVGVDGISIDAGCTTHHDVEAYTNRALIKRASRAIVVADGSKLGRVAFARICELGEVDELITDSAADPGQLQQLRDGGLEITTT